jgi:hypothetical protein
VNGVRVSAASTSTSRSTPITSPPERTTGTWRTPRSIIVSAASDTVTSGSAVSAGALITSLTGTSWERPAAITRARRSWSVTIP